MVRKLLKNLLLHFSSEVQTLLLQHAVALCQNNLRLQLNKRELYKGYFFTCRRHSLYICFLRSFHSKGLLLNKNTIIIDGMLVCFLMFFTFQSITQTE